MSPAAFSGFIATVLATVMLAPQVVKLARTNDVAGLSAAWVALGFTTNVAWTIYLVGERLALAAASTSIAAAFYGIVWFQLGRNRVPLRGAGYWALVASLSLALIYSVFGWATFGLVMGFTYFVQVAPSVTAAFRHARPSGISPGTWTIAFVEGAFWMHYGVWHGDAPIIVFSVAAMISGMLMVGRYLATRSSPELAV